jgi:hypothetical protein
MGQFSVEKSLLPGSVLSGNQQDVATTGRVRDREKSENNHAKAALCVA